jgi:hypothetical protein
VTSISRRGSDGKAERGWSSIIDLFISALGVDGIEIQSVDDAISHEAILTHFVLPALGIVLLWVARYSWRKADLDASGQRIELIAMSSYERPMWTRVPDPSPMRCAPRAALDDGRGREAGALQ